MNSLNSHHSHRNVRTAGVVDELVDVVLKYCRVGEFSHQIFPKNTGIMNVLQGVIQIIVDVLVKKKN